MTMSDVQMYVTNNVFYQQTTPFAVQSVASHMTSALHVHYNTFLSTDRVALELPGGYPGAAMDGTDNYWSTTDSTVIESMIYDVNDDPTSDGSIPYAPFLIAPDPGTPDPSPWIP